MTDDSSERIISILTEASALLGEGTVLLQIVSQPVVEWVFVGVEDGSVVVTDNGETFASIVGLRGSNDEYVPWSPEQAARAAQRFGVDLVDESGPLDEDGERSWEAFSLSRRVASGESVADVVQAVARAIDGVMALHTRQDASSHGSYLWDRDEAGKS